MAPEPRRKDRNPARERPAGLEPAEESAPPPEEYTTYPDADREETRDREAEARREAEMQPGGKDGKD